MFYKFLRCFFFFSCLFAAAAGAQGKPDFSLANNYAADEVDLSDYWMSEKYDAARALWDGSRLVSRGGKIYIASGWLGAGLLLGWRTEGISAD